MWHLGDDGNGSRSSRTGRTTSCVATCRLAGTHAGVPVRALCTPIWALPVPEVIAHALAHAVAEPVQEVVPNDVEADLSSFAYSSFSAS